MREMLQQTTQQHLRYLYNDINWNARMIGIVGARGVGKSTMVLQHIKKYHNPAKLFMLLPTISISTLTHCFRLPMIFRKMVANYW